MVEINSVTELIEERYGTADPFIIAERLNVEVDWVHLGLSPLGKTMYDGHAPLVILNDRIKNSPLRYFTMAHELGHVILQEDLVGYYTLARNGHSSLEVQANKFAVSLLSRLYIEENYHIPHTYMDLVHAYGLPLDKV
mgnify:FL=1